MRLPDYSGPFAVGAIDLEVPVREPCSFGAEYVPNHEINQPADSRHHKIRPKTNLKTKLGSDPSASSSPLASSTAPSSSGKAQKVAQKARDSAKERAEKGGPDHDANDELKQNPIEGTGQGPDEKNTQSKRKESTRQDGESSQQDQLEDWNPLTGGAKTSTLHLATVLFTIFYPSSVKEHERKAYSELAWIGRPKMRSSAAFMSYLGQYGPIALPAAPAILSLIRAQIPALAGAPLADPNSNMSRAPPPNDKVEMGNFGGEPPKFPVVVFSHGLAGNRLSYSHFCGELASNGIVVAALEHRDGSGVASMVRAPIGLPTERSSTEQGKRHGKQAEQNSPRQGQRRLDVRYFPFEKVGLRSFAEDPSEREVGLRQAQLAMRAAEIRECLYLLRQIDAGHGEMIAKNSTRGLTSKLAQKTRVHSTKNSSKSKKVADEANQLASWKGRLDAEFPTLCGHSFGGATVIELQRKPASETSHSDQQHGDKAQAKHGHSNLARTENEAASPFPFAIALDPWVDPLIWKSGDDQEGQEARTIPSPIYVINSETFTVWREHFLKLKRILRDSINSQIVESDAHRHGWLMTLAGCQHLDFSDLPLILPHVFRSTVGPQKTISIFSRATYAQIGLVRQRRRDLLGLSGVKTEDVWPAHEEKQDRKKRVKQEVSDDLQNGVATVVTTKVDRQGTTDSQSDKADTDAALNGKHERENPTCNDFKPESEKTHEQSSSKDETPIRKDASMPSADRVIESAESTDKTLSEKRDIVKREKDAATNRFWKASKERERRRRIVEERRERGLHAVYAERTPDGDIRAQPADLPNDGSRENEEEHLATIDFTDRPDDVAGDPDAGIVHKRLSDVVAKLSYKRPKIHSLMGLMFRVKGLHPGLDQPGRLLVHDLQSE